MTPEQIKELDEAIARAEAFEAALDWDMDPLERGRVHGRAAGLHKAKEIMGNKDGGKNAN